MRQSSDFAHTLYWGENVHVLHTHLPDASIDLTYLDPPFYSQRSYQALFKQTNARKAAQAKVPAFRDIWRWEPSLEQSYVELLARAPTTTSRALTALHQLLGPGPLLAYLVMMTECLLELHRVLKPTGSLYLHCDPAASHYLKLLLDAVFGPTNFRNEIVWSYKTGGASQRHFSRKHDLLLFYAKSASSIFHIPKEKSYMLHRYGFKKSTFLNDAQGAYTWVYMKDVWELPALGASDKQRLGYPTQKPERLLERILQASSDEGALVLDPFCGSGTTLAVAQRLGRRWLGIENNALGIAYQRYRLACTFPQLHYTYVGGPSTLAEARLLASSNAAQFRWWALSLVCARPSGAADNPNAGIAQGTLSNSSGTYHVVAVVTLDLYEISTIQRLYQPICHEMAAKLLIITLEAPPSALSTQLVQTLASLCATLQIVTVAELLSETQALSHLRHSSRS